MKRMKKKMRKIKLVPAGNGRRCESYKPRTRPDYSQLPQRHTTAATRYLDVEAEVDNDEEEDDDDEELQKETREGFIDEDEGLDSADGRQRIVADHQRLDRRQQEIIDQDAEEVAQRLKARYARPAARYMGDVDQVPQRLLMPSVKDAFLWQIRVKVGSRAAASLQPANLDLL